MAIKVLVGCPTSHHKAYCLDKYVRGLNNLTYPHKEILIVENSKEDEYFNKISKLLPTIKGSWNESARQRIVDSRNLLRKKALEEKYDYFFSLEQDIVPPPDVIERLLSHGKKIISGVYYKPFKITDLDGTPGNPFSLFNNQGKPASEMNLPLIWKKTVFKDKIEYADSSFVEKPRLIEIGAAGVGCLLIHKSVLEKIKFRFDPKQKAFDDMMFAEDVANNGFRMFADTSIKCMHYVGGMDWDKIKR